MAEAIMWSLGDTAAKGEWQLLATGLDDRGAVLLWHLGDASEIVAHFSDAMLDAVHMG